jgi:hypothetical protein
LIVPHPEILFVVGMVGLYLYDSALLLASNEALLSPVCKGRWRAMFGADGFQVRGKEPFCPNPLLPHRPLYRFSWNMEGLAGSGQAWSPPGNVYTILAPSVWLMLLALFVLIPAGLFSRLGSLAVVAGIVFFYLNALLALALVWIKRADYAICGRRFASLAIESLTCPPFALNMVRRLSLGLQPREDFLSVIDQCLTGSERDAALTKVIIRVKNEIDWEDEGSARATALNAHLQFLSHESESCRESKS